MLPHSSWAYLVLHRGWGLRHHPLCVGGPRVSRRHSTSLSMWRRHPARSESRRPSPTGLRAGGAGHSVWTIPILTVCTPSRPRNQKLYLFRPGQNGVLLGRGLHPRLFNGLCRDRCETGHPCLPDWIRAVHLLLARSSGITVEAGHSHRLHL